MLRMLLPTWNSWFQALAGAWEVPEEGYPKCRVWWGAVVPEAQGLRQGPCFPGGLRDALKSGMTF